MQLYNFDKITYRSQDLPQRTQINRDLGISNINNKIFLTVCQFYMDINKTNLTYLHLRHLSTRSNMTFDISD